MFDTILEFLSDLDFAWWILIAMGFFILIFGRLAYNILIDQFRDMK